QKKSSCCLPSLCCRDAAVNRFPATLLRRRRARDELAPLSCRTWGPSSQVGATTKDHLARAVGLTDDSTLAAAGDCCVADFRPSLDSALVERRFPLRPQKPNICALMTNECAPWHQLHSSIHLYRLP